MLIGSIEEKDLFLNSVLSNVFGSECYLEKGDRLYTLWMRNYSDLDGDRHYENSYLIEQGTLETCIGRARRICDIDMSCLEQLDEDL
jgi:hypothetical protein